MKELTHFLIHSVSACGPVNMSAVSRFTGWCKSQCGLPLLTQRNKREINHESHILQCCPPSREGFRPMPFLQQHSYPMSLSQLDWAKPMFGMNNWSVSQWSFLWSAQSWMVSVFIIFRNVVKWMKCLYFTCGLFSVPHTKNDKWENGLFKIV